MDAWIETTTASKCILSHSRVCKVTPHLPVSASDVTCTSAGVVEEMELQFEAISDRFAELHALSKAEAAEASTKESTLVSTSAG